MARLKPVEIESASGRTKEVLDAVKQKMGKVPNIFQLMANSPAAVEAYLSFSGSLSKGVLSPQLREQIAITCAEVNACEYCLSAHVAIAKSIGLDSAEIEKARLQRSSDSKTDAILTFVRTLLLKRAELPDEDIAALREQAVTDAEIAEIVANVSLNLFTNYFNHIAKTENDFPKVALAFQA